MIPAGWKSASLADICNFIEKGKRKASFGKNRGQFIFVPSALTTKYCDEADYVETSIVLGDGGVANVHYVDTPFSASDHTYVLREKDKSNVVLKYVYYNLLANIEHIQKGFGGAAIKNVSKTYLKNTPIIYPDLPEQQRIVAKLDALFADIDAQKQITQQSLQNAEELFESFSDKIFEEPHDGWLVKNLGAISNQKQSKNEIKCSEQDMVTFAPMEQLGIGSKYLFTKTTKTLSEEKTGYTYFAENDVLMAKITPCFENGKIGIAKKLENGIGFGSTEYIVFRPLINLDIEFLYYFLNRKTFRMRGAKRMLGAAGHKRVSKDFINEYPFQYPSNIETQKQIVCQLDAVYEQTQSLRQIYTQQIADLDELKQAILKKAFNGEL